MRFPDSKVHGANIGPTWVLSAPGGPHIGPTNLAIRVVLCNWWMGILNGPCQLLNVTSYQEYHHVQSLEKKVIIWVLTWLSVTHFTITVVAWQTKELFTALQWHHNERDGASNYQPRDCLFNHLFRRSSKKTSKLRITGLCEGHSPVTGEFPAQRASNAENIPIWWRHNDD